jgi:putative DNA primase/helicase
MSTFTTTVQQLIAHQLVLIALDGKRPIESGWQKRTVSLQPADFDANTNVGVVLGDASGGVVDVDIDSPEAEALADVFLAHTDCVFGRPSKPKSHRFYRVEKSGRTSQFKLPEGMIVELRGNGGSSQRAP